MNDRTRGPVASLRVGLVGMLLVPLLSVALIVAGPVGQASAVTTVGDYTTGKWGVSEAASLGSWWSCAARFAYQLEGNESAAIQKVKVAAGDCNDGSATNISEGTMTLSANGSDCTLGSGTIAWGTDDRFALVIGQNIVPVPSANLCVVNKICWHVVGNNGAINPGASPFFTYEREGCFSVTIPPWKMPGGGGAGNCPILNTTLTSVATQWVKHATDNSYKLQVKASWSSDVKLGLNLVYRNNASGEYNRGNGGFGIALPPSMKGQWVDYPLGYAWLQAGFNTPYPLVGVQAAVQGEQSGTAAQGSAELSNPWVPFDVGVIWEAWRAPSQVSPGQKPYLGTTFPSECRWYWGEQIAAGDTGTPAGGLDGGSLEPDPGTATPDTPTPGGCAFSWTDPSTYMCGMLGILKDLLDAIFGLARALASLAGAIVGPIVDALGHVLDGLVGMLSALFVPDDLPAFDDIPNPLPAGWLPNLSGVAGSSCGAVTMPSLSLGDMAGTSAPAVLFNTCNDPWPFARTITYNGTLALVLVTILWRAYRAVATALGMQVDSPGGGDDD